MDIIADVSCGTRRNLYDRASAEEQIQAPIIAARSLIETGPNYAYVNSSQLLDKLRSEALSFVQETAQQAIQAEIDKTVAKLIIAI